MTPCGKAVGLGLAILLLALLVPAPCSACSAHQSLSGGTENTATTTTTTTTRTTTTTTQKPSKHVKTDYATLYDFSGHKPDLEGKIQICPRYGFS